MKMIKLSDSLFISADQITEVKVSEHGNITVRTKGGIGHHVENDYGKGPYDTVDRLIREINDAWKTIK